MDVRLGNGSQTLAAEMQLDERDKAFSVALAESGMPSYSEAGSDTQRIAGVSVQAAPAKTSNAIESSLTPFDGSDFSLRSENINPAAPIKTIYLNPKANQGGPDLAFELQQIGWRRGFSVSTQSGATKDVWAEDNALVFTNERGGASLLVSGVSPKTFQSARSAIRDMAKNEELGDVFNLGRAFSNGLSGRVGQEAADAGWDVRSTPFAIEGGNLIATADKNGEPVALIGRNTVLVNWKILKIENKLPSEEVQKVLDTGSFDGSLAQELKDLADIRGKPIDLNAANTQAAEIEVTRRMLAQTLKLKPSNLISIEQHGFHIDMETRSLDNGVVMVSDLNQSMKNLDITIADLKAQPSADPEAIKELEGLKNRTWVALQGGAQDILDKKAQTLEDAGFQVIREATNYGGIGSRGRPWDAGNIDVNFANGIVAVDKDGKRYMITNRSGSETLNQKFQQDMKQRGIDVEWVSTGDLLRQLGGIDCVTLHKQNK